MRQIRWAVASAVGFAMLLGFALSVVPVAAQSPPPGFTALFRGKDLDQWRIPKNDGRHWRLYEDMIDYDGLSQAPKNETKDLWTRRTFRDFVLLVDWRLKGEPGFRHRVPALDKDGNQRKDREGKDIWFEIDDIQSGILLRGKDDNEVNICKWPSGSGGIGGARRDSRLPPETRAAYTPREKADNPPGEWNTFEITVQGDRVTVRLNGKEVIPDAPLPDPTKEGPIGLMHAGTPDLRLKRWRSPPSLVQFRNIYIKELK